jgi:hypothetical protein
LLKNNAVLEISIFDKKGNPNGKVVCKVISSDGTEEKVSSKVFNEKGKELINAEEVYNCDENNFSVDVKAILPGDQSKSMNMKDMEIKANNA